MTYNMIIFFQQQQDRMGQGPLDTMRSLEQFLPGDQPRGFMGPESGPKGELFQNNTSHSRV